MGKNGSFSPGASWQTEGCIRSGLGSISRSNIPRKGARPDSRERTACGKMRKSQGSAEKDAPREGEIQKFKREGEEAGDGKGKS